MLHQNPSPSQDPVSRLTPDELLQEIRGVDNLLIVQDLNQA